jgi:NAD(P)H-hydrate epimerase
LGLELQKALKTEGGLVYLTAEELAGADRAAIQEYGVDVLLLMENAGAAVARLARKMLGGGLAGKRIACLVGKGNNGGDGLVAARHLHNWSAEVGVVLPGPAGDLGEIPSKQLGIVKKMGIEVAENAARMPEAELCVDALLGYGSSGNPREPMASLIRSANDSKVPILAVDLPSGLDASRGEPGDTCITAQATITFGFAKAGFLNPRAKSFLGELYLADVSIPAGVYRKYGQTASYFERDNIVKLW